MERYAVAPSIRHVEVEGLRVILDLDSERYRILDDAGSALWPVLIGERDPAAAYAALAEEYDLDRERWDADLTAFAGRCLEEGLLVRDGEPATAGPAPVRV
nr:PqqD family peptide modification chaperone [Actinomycetota bacterium]